MRTIRTAAMAVVTGMLLAAATGVVSGETDETRSDVLDASPGRLAADLAIRAWATGDIGDIEAAYGPDVVMVIDDDTLATDRDQIASVIKQAVGVGNAYQQVGPVIEYEASDGDLYLGSIVEVTGTGHPKGVPVVGFYRVRDGKVIRHIFMDAEHY